MGIRYELDAVQKLADVGGGHPFLTRQLCGRAILSPQKERLTVVTLSDAERAIREYLADPRNYMAESLWAADQGGPSNQQCEMLYLLARKPSVTMAELLPTTPDPDESRRYELAFANLQDTGLIERAKNNLDEWQLSIPLYRQWIRLKRLHIEQED